MDLIYMNEAFEDVGVLLEYDFDLAFGTDENTFECVVSNSRNYCKDDFFLYIEGTEYGGIIDGIQSKGSTNEVIYYGRTWHGILNSKVLCPDAGKDYLVCNGEANTVIGSLLTRMGLTSMFSVSAEASGLTINNYKMNRFITGYDGITKMLKTVNGKLLVKFQGGKVVLCAAPLVDYTQEGLDSDFAELDVKQMKNTVNHLICLGRGELAERTVVHLYADSEGNISTTQTQKGINEISAVYEDTNAEDADALKSAGTDRLKELMQQDDLSVDFDEKEDLYDVGDIVGAFDNVTGISIAVPVTKKIVTIKNGKVSIDIKTKTAKANSSNIGSGSSGGGSDFSQHIEDKNNPHGVTAAQTGALPLSGGSMNGAINFRNDTWNNMGDDAAIGDCNISGNIGIKALNGTPGITLFNKDGSKAGKVYAENFKPTAADVDALPSTGGTITGPLTISRAGYPDLTLKNETDGSATLIRNTANRTQIMSQESGANYIVLTIHDKKAAPNSADILQMMEIVNGVQKAKYRIYGDHNKPSAQELGAIPATGGGVSGPIYGTTDRLELKSSTGDDTIDRRLMVYSKTHKSWGDLKHAVSFWANDSGTSKLYSLFGEHNPPTADDVGALPLAGGTLTGWELGLQNRIVRICSTSGSQGCLQFDVYSAPGDGTQDRRTLYFQSASKKPALNEALKIETTINGAKKYYNIYGEHNKPSTSDIVGFGNKPKENALPISGAATGGNLYYMKTHDGICILRGVLAGSFTNGCTIGTIPSGYRPANAYTGVAFLTKSGGTSVCTYEVLSNGTVRLQNVSGTFQYVTLCTGIYVVA